MKYVGSPFQSPSVLSFCPGILGIERGLARAGVNVRVAAYVEIEAFIIANLVAGMEQGLVDSAPVWTDAKTFDARPFRGRIHGIIGGYPCPGESTAGLREGHLYKGFIWPAIRKAIAAGKPLWCFFENVDDHLTGTYPIVQRSLSNMGYAVEAGIYTAEEVGAPHERQRLFILALANAESINWGLFLQQWTSRKNCFEPNGSGETMGGQRLWSHNGIGGETLWPAGQGYYQHEWEEPRAVESGVGCTTHGYNFREDLIRAIGNSVVEQVAELAFVDLAKKHLRNSFKP